MAPKRIPDRWEPYIPIGSPVRGTRFIALKVPLKETYRHNGNSDTLTSLVKLIQIASQMTTKTYRHNGNSDTLTSLVKLIQIASQMTTKSICANLEPRLQWTIDIMTSSYPNIGMIVDLTMTTRYYDYEDILSKGVDYCKIALPGQKIPSEPLVKRFFAAVDFYLDCHRDDSLIGIHCTHGVNRTGYMIARYMIQRMGFSLSDTLERITVARGHPIEREYYVSDLGRHLAKKPKVLDGSDIHQGQAAGERPRMSPGVKAAEKKKPFETRTGKDTVRRHGPVRNDNREGNPGEWKKPRRDVNPWEPGFVPDGGKDFGGPPHERFDNPRGRGYRGPNMNKRPVAVWENEKSFDDEVGPFEEQNFSGTMEEPFDRFPRDDGMVREQKDRQPRKRFPDKRGPNAFREDHGPSLHFREGREPSHPFREEHEPFVDERGHHPRFSDERGPPQNFREDREQLPPFRDERPQQFRDERRPAQFREEQAPAPPFREEHRPPPPFREERGPPPPSREGPRNFRDRRSEREENVNRGRSDEFNQDGVRGSDSARKFDAKGRHHDEDWEYDSPPQPGPMGDRRGFQGRRGSSPHNRENRYHQEPPQNRRMPPPGRQISPKGRRMSPPGRRMSPPPGRRMSPPPGRRMSTPPGRRMSTPPGRRMSPPPGRRMSPPPGRRMSPPPGRRMSPPPGRRMPPGPGRTISPPTGRRVGGPPGRRMSPQGRTTSPPGRRTSPQGRRMASPQGRRMSPPRPRRMTPPPEERMADGSFGRMPLQPQHREFLPPQHPQRVFASQPRLSPPRSRRMSPPQGDTIPFHAKPGHFDRPTGESFVRSRSPPQAFKPPASNFDERRREHSPGIGRLRRSRSPVKRRSPPPKRRGSPLDGRMTPPPFKKDSRQQRPAPKDQVVFGPRKDAMPPVPRGNAGPFDRGDSGHGSGRPRPDNHGFSIPKNPRFGNKHDGPPNPRDRGGFEDRRLGSEHFQGPILNEREENFIPVDHQPFEPVRSAPTPSRGGRSPPPLMNTEQYPPREDIRRPPHRHLEEDSYEHQVGRQPFRSPECSPTRKERRPDNSKREQRPLSRDQSREDHSRTSRRSKSSNTDRRDERPNFDKRNDGPSRRMDAEGHDFHPPPIHTERSRFNDQQGSGPRNDRYSDKYKHRGTENISSSIHRDMPQMKEPTNYSPRPKRSSSPGFPEINDKGWDAELEQDCRELILQKRINTVSRSIGGRSNSSITQRLDGNDDVIIIEDSSDQDRSRPPSRSHRRPASSRLSPKLERVHRSRSPRSKKPVFDRLEDKKPPIFERLEEPSRRPPPVGSPRKPRGPPRGRR